jgi:hypothetical protein
MFVSKHLSKFRSCFPSPLALASSEDSEGRSPERWFNLLAGRQLVKLDQHLIWQLKRGQPVQRADSFVSNLNMGRDYEGFCQYVEALSDEMGSAWTPELTERALIADGGRTPHPWRAYVVEQRLAAISIL